MSRALAVLLAVSACGDNHAAGVLDGAPADAGPADAVDAAVDAAIDAPPDAAATPLEVTAIDFGLARALVATTRTSTVTNPGDVAVAITSIATTGPDLAIDSATCGTSLDPHQSCTVTVRLLAATFGDHAGMLHVTASSGVATGTIAGGVGGEIDVALPASGMGVGSGRVTSTPAGVDCASTGPNVMPVTCPGVFTGSITLVAQPDPGFVFAGWVASGCGASPTCVVAPGLDPKTVSAFFLPAGFHVLTVTSGGTAPVDVYLSANSPMLGYVEVTCVAPCALPVPAGWDVQLGASTTSTYVGMTGACTTTTTTCLFTPAADAAVVVTADRAPNETASLMFPVAIVAVGVDSQGALVIGTQTSVRKLDAAGNLVWAIAAATPPQIEISADDHVTTLIGTQLTRWTPDGVAEWELDVAMPSELTVARDGTVLLRTLTTLTELGADGVMRWQLAKGSYLPVKFYPGDDFVFAEPNVVVAAEHYAADGSHLGTIVTDLCDESGGFALAAEANGGVACSNASSLGINLQRWSATGTSTLFEHPGTAIDDSLVWLAPNDDGGLWWVHEQFQEVDAPIGFVVHHFDAANTETQLVRGLLQEDLPLRMRNGCDPADVRATAGGVVVGGYYTGFAAAGFVQAFAK